MATAAKLQAAAPRAETGKPKAPAPPAGSAVPHEKIAERAYQIWQASGRADGHDQEHWFQAERELRAARPASRAALQ
jgi:hypothetical protein